MILDRRQAKRSIKMLNRRRDWLTGRVVQSRKELSFDRAERLALEIAITVLSGLMEGQKVEVSSGRSINTPCAGKAQGRAADSSQSVDSVQNEISHRSSNG